MKSKCVGDTHITPKTPAGPSPSPLVSGAIAPHAAEVRTSKTYVQESMVPTKDRRGWEAMASRSQRNDMIVDLLRELSGHGEPSV